MPEAARTDNSPEDEPDPELFKGDGPAPNGNLEIAMLCDHLLERGVLFGDRATALGSADRLRRT